MNRRRGRVSKQRHTVRGCVEIGILSQEPAEAVCIGELDVEADAFTQSVSKDLGGVQVTTRGPVTNSTICRTTKVVVQNQRIAATAAKPESVPAIGQGVAADIGRLTVLDLNGRTRPLARFIIGRI